MSAARHRRQALHDLLRRSDWGRPRDLIPWRAIVFLASRPFPGQHLSPSNPLYGITSAARMPDWMATMGEEDFTKRAKRILLTVQSS